MPCVPVPLVPQMPALPALPAAATGDLIRQMTEAFSDAEVTGYRSLIEGLTCDPKDRHVLAAAVRADAGAIVTFNTTDFPPESTEPYICARAK